MGVDVIRPGLRRHAFVNCEILPGGALRKIVIEFIGTFFLMLTVGVTVLSGSAFAPLAIGAVLMVMVYAGGHLSGAHYNPAVTIAVLIRGRIGLRDAGGYWLAQFAGGLLGALVARAVVGDVVVGSPAPAGGMVAVFAVEALFTFALAYVVLNVATSDDHPDNSFYGLAIGFTVAAGALTVGGISGGAFNPAVVVGGAAIGLFPWSALWLYVLATGVGAAAGGAVFRVVTQAPAPEPAASVPGHHRPEPAG